MPANQVSINIDGIAYTGWEEVSIHSSIERLTSSFEVKLSDTIEGNLKLLSQKRCTIKIDSDLVLTGYVEKIDVSIDKDSHTVTVSGRDLLADLIDCSVIGPPYEFRNKNLAQHIETFVKPFGILFRYDKGVFASARKMDVTLSPGDSVFEAIDKARRQEGVLLYSDAQGRMLMGYSGKEASVDSLIWGQNIKKANVVYDDSNRFKDYYVRGQNSGGSNFDDFGVTLDVVGHAKDPRILRHRPVMLHSEGEVTQTTAKKRAEWEAIVRSAGSSVVQVIVAGFRQGNGALWKKNTIAPVSIPPLYINSDMLISDVSFSKSSNGTETALTLKRPDAFTPEPVIAIKQKHEIGFDD
jgi:prophage tail gpP-like protein